jgi:putative tryptophan/tyrosine transport system substrate-binding protein
MSSRREFITLLGGAAAAWPLAARGQQGDRMPRIGVLSSSSAHERTSQLRLTALQQGLQRTGWIEGRNIQIEKRWSAGNVENLRAYAAELVAHAPDAILANGSAATTQLSQATRTVPIVFTDVPDPVGAGLVDSLARPGGNVTGFMLFEYSISGKWLELLKEIAPTITQAAVLRDPSMIAGVGQFAAIQSVAPSLGVDLRPIDVRDAAEIERGMLAFAQRTNRGVIVVSSPLAALHRDLIIRLAAEHKLPAVYSFGYYAASGGLMAYGPDPNDPFRRAADYIDRILKGEKPADLPVQAPTKFELIINLKTAKALGLTVPDKLLVAADEVIE